MDAVNWQSSILLRRNSGKTRKQKMYEGENIKWGATRTRLLPPPTTKKLCVMRHGNVARSCVLYFVLHINARAQHSISNCLRHPLCELFLIFFMQQFIFILLFLYYYLHSITYGWCLSFMFVGATYLIVYHILLRAYNNIWNNLLFKKFLPKIRTCNILLQHALS